MPNSLTCCIQVAFRQCRTQLIIMCVCCVGECLHVGHNVELLQVNLVCGRTSCSFCRNSYDPHSISAELSVGSYHYLVCSMSPTSAVCVKCLDHTACKLCGACEGPWYCSKECQLQDWRVRHKYECPSRERTRCMKSTTVPLPEDIVQVVLAYTGVV